MAGLLGLAGCRVLDADGRETTTFRKACGLTLNPRGSIYTTIMELGPKRPFILWFWGPNSIMVVYMDP